MAFLGFMLYTQRFVADAVSWGALLDVRDDGVHVLRKNSFEDSERYKWEHIGGATAKPDGSVGFHLKLQGRGIPQMNSDRLNLIIDADARRAQHIVNLINSRAAAANSINDR